MSSIDVEYNPMGEGGVAHDNLTLEQRGFSGRRVDFPSNRGLAWGVEIDYPITAAVRENLGKHYLHLPERITMMKILDLSSQENLPVEQRNILPKKPYEPFTGLTLLQWLTKLPELEAGKGLVGGIKDVFRDDVFLGARKKFTKKLEGSLGNTLMLIIGHGGRDPWQIGEQGDNNVKNKLGKIVQKRGNAVSYMEIFRHYDDPDKYAGILFAACYMGKRELKRLKVPAARIKGLYGSYSGIKGYFDQWKFRKSQVT